MESHGKSLVIKPLNVFIKASFSLPDVSRDDLSPNIINQDFRNESQLSGHGSEYANLLICVQKAREASDKLLTALIDHEKQSKVHPVVERINDESPEKKKSRFED